MFSCSCAYLCISWCIEVILNLFTNRFVSTTKISMKYVVNWISLRIAFVREIPNPTLPPPHHQIYFRNWYAFPMLKVTKFAPPSILGCFHVLLHKKFHEQVHSARSSCTANARPLNGFENGPNLTENRIEHVLLTTSKGNSIFFSANRRAWPGSQKWLLNGCTEWKFLRNKEKAYQNRE